jgi:HD-like signal output (HDOD) protein
MAEQLARLHPSADPCEAFVSGLIHDIGRLAVELTSPEVAHAYHRIANDCRCPMFAEFAIFGRTHCEIGAALLADWGVPHDIVAAVKAHHHPDDQAGTIAALLCLAENGVDDTEGVSCQHTLESAARIAGFESLNETMLRAVPDQRCIAAFNIISDSYCQIAS